MLEMLELLELLGSVQQPQNFVDSYPKDLVLLVSSALGMSWERP